jgi:hypothetical protein
VHAICFEFQAGIQIARRHNFKIVSAIVGSGGIVVSTNWLKQIIQTLFLQRIVKVCSLEHQVFQEMCGSGIADCLVARTHLIDDISAEHRSVVSLAQNYA